MTQNVIEELRGLYEAGTKGMWRTYTCDSYSPVYGGADDQRVADRPSPNIMWQADSALIVAMHRHLPALLLIAEAAERLKAVREKLLAVEGGKGFTKRFLDAKSAEYRAHNALWEALSRLTAQGKTP